MAKRKRQVSSALQGTDQSEAVGKAKVSVKVKGKHTKEHLQGKGRLWDRSIQGNHRLPIERKAEA